MRYCSFCDKVIINAPNSSWKFFKEYNKWACFKCSPSIERKLLAKEIVKQQKILETQND